MENKSKIKVAVAIACCWAAISVLLAARRKKRKQKQEQSSKPCYLKTEQKPQHAFKRVLADNSYSQFKHLKLHTPSKESGASSLHPYVTEIGGMLREPDVGLRFFEGEADFEMGESYVWVDTESKLVELAEALSGERVFGVDTEQHGLRSFLGFTALVQISTKSKDYLVDSIALHDVMGILRPVFANPKVCKVFHGADNDVLWLQRDFHIYVVNLFDTAKACDVLSKPQKSLAYLLETYCDLGQKSKDGNASGSRWSKVREDWRQRPLPIEMVEYARTDAHYLLYIAECLATELKEHDNVEEMYGVYHTPKMISVSENSDCLDDEIRFVLEASQRSNTICLQLFSKETEAYPGESAASSIISRHLNGQGSALSVLGDIKLQDIVRQLCAWRDLMARVHDENLRYFLSDQAVVALANIFPLSETDIYDTIVRADLNVDSLNLASSIQSPSPVVCSHVEELSYFFQNVIDKPDEIFQLTLQKVLGPNGSCPLSVYNYGLLSKSNMKLTTRLVSKENGKKSAKQFITTVGYMQMTAAYYVIVIAENLNGFPEDEDNNFYTNSKKNICVGCGEGNHYLRYRVIPSCYRIHFPEHLKSHRSHDIVLLCVDCHEVAHAAAEKYKKQISAEFGIPLFIRKVIDSSQAQDISASSSSVVHIHDTGVSPLELRSASMALLRHGTRMPPKRHEELTQIVMRYYGGRDITEEDLERALLVGMSPHEKRRFEKKRGFLVKQSTKSLSLVEEVENNGIPSISDNALNSDDVDGSHVSNGDTSSKDERDPSLVRLDSEEASVSDSMDMNSELESDFNSERSLSNGTVSSLYPTSDGGAPLTRNSKLSLLGHGPHGKQVVDHLLKKYGDNGISQFCQRWRQVFVEAVHPRFLPAGWDVMH
ncbi:hypothetical protein RJ640_011319, partial [Escallonia rubra]